jgi:arabinogalactan oligomer/maltooligosaccharide transport system substrate-binding protein
MNKKLKVLSSVMSVLIISSVLAGCGSSSTTSTGSKELVIWSEYTGKDLPVITKLANDWAKKTGNKVKVVDDKTGADGIMTAYKSSHGPDVVIGYPNDHLGEYVKAGAVDAVPAGVMKDSDYIDPALAACSVGGKKYAVPLTLETYLLFYNKDKVQTPPKTWDELVDMGKKVGFNYCLNDMYYSLALIQGCGGYVFKNNNGKLDTNDIGLNNEGAVKGFSMVNDLANTSGLVSPSVTGDIARGNFQNGKVGLYLSGPWDVSTFKAANVNFGVAPYPEITDGTPVPTTATVKLAVVSGTSKNKDVAWDFMKYVAANAPYAIFKNTAAIPVLKADQAKAEIKNDPITSVFAEQAKYAVPMPTAPEFGYVWEPAKDNLTLMVTKKETPKQAADNLVAQLKQKIQENK